MNYLDVAILAVVGTFSLKGLWRGFFQEVLGLVSLVAAFILATKYMSNVSFLIKKVLTIPPGLITLLGFLLVFFATILAFQFLIHALQKAARFSSLGWLEKLSGGLVGFLKGATVVSLLLLFISMIPFTRQLLPDRSASRLYDPARKFAPGLFNLIIKTVPHSKSFYAELKESLDNFSWTDLSENTQKFLDSLKKHESSTDGNAREKQSR
ncbi:MAG: CvpA family protein [bacterium]